jgi:hypothetical protein
MMPQRPMPKIGGQHFRFIEPGMQRQIIVHRAAPFFYR